MPVLTFCSPFPSVSTIVLFQASVFRPFSPGNFETKGFFVHTAAEPDIEIYGNKVRFYGERKMTMQSPAYSQWVGMQCGTVFLIQEKYRKT